jgi:hypothetical protein
MRRMYCGTSRSFLRIPGNWINSVINKYQSRRPKAHDERFSGDA